MVVEASDIVRDVDHTLSRIRASLDPTSLFAFTQKFERDSIVRAYLDFEHVRVDTRLSRMVRQGGYQDIERRLQTLRERLINLIGNGSFGQVAGGTKFRGVASRPSTIFVLNPLLMSRDLDVLQAIQLLIDSIGVFPFRQPILDLAPNASQLEIAAELKKVIPKSQDVGPVQFDVDERARVYIKDQPSQQLPRDEQAISEARSEILDSHSRLIELLSKSNCDKRIIESIEVLRERVENGNDIVRLGLANISCEIIYRSCKDELSDTVYAMVEAHTVTVNMFVSQFPEWQRFSDQAASISLLPEHARPLSEALGHLIEQTRDKIGVADPEVPKTLAFLRKIIDDPAGASKKVLFAAWRTVENFLQAVFKYGANFFRQTADDTSKKLSQAASTGIVIVLLGVALKTAAPITPLADVIQSGGWIKQAIEVVKRQIETAN